MFVDFTALTSSRAGHPWLWSSGTSRSLLSIYLHKPFCPRMPPSSQPNCVKHKASGQVAELLKKLHDKEVCLLGANQEAGRRGVPPSFVSKLIFCPTPARAVTVNTISSWQKCSKAEATRHLTLTRCCCNQKEAEEAEKEYKKRVHELQVKFTSRNNQLVQALDQMKAEKAQRSSLCSALANECKRLRILLKLSQESPSDMAEDWCLPNQEAKELPHASMASACKGRTESPADSQQASKSELSCSNSEDKENLSDRSSPVNAPSKRRLSEMRGHRPASKFAAGGENLLASIPEEKIHGLEPDFPTCPLPDCKISTQIVDHETSDDLTVSGRPQREPFLAGETTDKTLQGSPVNAMPMPEKVATVLNEGNILSKTKVPRSTLSDVAVANVDGEISTRHNVGQDQSEQTQNLHCLKKTRDEVQQDGQGSSDGCSDEEMVDMTTSTEGSCRQCPCSHNRSHPFLLIKC